jgi:hypothetical protein
MTVPGKPNFASQSEGPIRYGAHVIVYGCGDGCRCGECHGIIRSEADHRAQGLSPFGDKVLVYFTSCGERIVNRTEVFDEPEMMKRVPLAHRRAR